VVRRGASRVLEAEGREAGGLSGGRDDGVDGDGDAPREQAPRAVDDGERDALDVAAAAA